MHEGTYNSEASAERLRRAYDWRSRTAEEDLTLIRQAVASLAFTDTSTLDEALRVKVQGKIDSLILAVLIAERLEFVTMAITTRLRENIGEVMALLDGREWPR